MHEAEKTLLFEDLFKQHFRQLYVHAYSWVHDEEWAKDIVHDAYCQLWENFDRYTDEPHLLSLLYTFVRSRSIDHLRHDQAQENYVQAQKASDEDNREEYLHYEELIARVMAAVRRLLRRHGACSWAASCTIRATKKWPTNWPSVRSPSKHSWPEP